MREGVKALVEEVASWPGVTTHEHRFGGTEFRIGAREIGHVHLFGIVDIPFTVKIRDALIRSGKAERHHWVPDSGWTTVGVKKHGRENALALLRLSYLRVQAKNSDWVAANEAVDELTSCGLDHEVLEAVGLPVAIKG
jgi:hypothetical protein